LIFVRDFLVVDRMLVALARRGRGTRAVKKKLRLAGCAGLKEILFISRVGAYLKTKKVVASRAALNIDWPTSSIAIV
jgi:hypothetical protein